ncbi:MAG: GNAT family N-acetyltransferase [Eubacterium sp.]
MLKEYRGNGLSKLILKEAIDKCIENKFELIRLHVAKNNNIAINLYKQYGFVESGYEENDVIEMTKLISVKENQ